jgi:hypothetical protein
MKGPTEQFVTPKEFRKNHVPAVAGSAASAVSTAGRMMSVFGIGVALPGAGGGEGAAEDALLKSNGAISNGCFLFSLILRKFE